MLPSVGLLCKHCSVCSASADLKSACELNVASSNVIMFHYLYLTWSYFLNAEEHYIILLVCVCVCVCVLVGECVFVLGRSVYAVLINAGPHSSALCYQSPLPSSL